MAVRAEQDEIGEPVIAPVAVDMLELNRNAPRQWMPLVPTASSTVFAELLGQVPPDKFRTLERIVLAALLQEGMTAWWHGKIPNMASVEIHRANAGDLDDLLPLFRAYRLFYERAAEPAAEHRFLRERLTNADSTIFIAREGTSAVGFVQLFTTFSSVYLGPALLLEDLFVHPDARGRGTASALLECSRSHAAQLRAVGMFLETAHTNRAAQRVYERAGWHPESVFRKYNCPLPVSSVP